jgi:hypothetical protein
VEQQQPFELENRLPGLRDFDVAEIVWFARPPALTAPFRVRILRTEAFAGFAQVDCALVSIRLPSHRWINGRTIVPFGYQKSRLRDFPKAHAYSPAEFLVYVAAHEMRHLLVGQYRGDLSTALDTAELSAPMLETLGAFDLERSYFRRLSVDGFTEERNADTYALQRLRSCRRRGSP